MQHAARHRGRVYRPRSGTEPVTARSDLPARLVLTAIFLPLFLIGTGGFGYLSASASSGETPGPGGWLLCAVVCAVMSVVAAIDLVVILKRRREERAG